MKVKNFTYFGKNKILFVLLENSQIAMFYCSFKTFNSYKDEYKNYFEYIHKLFQRAEKTNRVFIFNRIERIENFRIEVDKIAKTEKYKKVFPYNCYLKSAKRK